MRHRKPLLLSVIVAAVAALATPITALAETTRYSDTVTGVEIFASSTQGVFTGTAHGALPGTWTADVRHTALGGNPQAALINGGSISLATTLDESSLLITGAFVGGSVTQTGGFSPCGPQTYAVDGNLGYVGPYGQANTGTGHFIATLTHYRYSFFGSCITYSASIVGTVNLSF